MSASNNSSAPNKGSTVNVVVIPSSAKTVGNNPAKQPGHKPPINPRIIPIGASPACLRIFLASLYLYITRFIVIAKNAAIKRLSVMNGIVIHKLLFNNPGIMM